MQNQQFSLFTASTTHFLPTNRKNRFELSNASSSLLARRSLFGCFTLFVLYLWNDFSPYCLRFRCLQLNRSCRVWRVLHEYFSNRDRRNRKSGEIETFVCFCLDWPWSFHLTSEQNFRSVTRDAHKKKTNCRDDKINGCTRERKRSIRHHPSYT